MRTLVNYWASGLLALGLTALPWSGLAAQTAADAQADQNVEVLTRGPVHEAFAEPVQLDAKRTITIEQEPPAAIEELPPASKPAGNNVVWIPGYWAWDDDRTDFLWVSGVWRSTPPGQEWVPGYWSQVADGHYWTPGFWVSDKVEQIAYQPEPPSSLEEGPNSESPSENHFWVPGCWRYRDQRYVWRPGYWTPAEAGWIWIPAHHVWTPSGCIYVDGYWDHEIEQRGVCFAPVYFHEPAHVHATYRYTPAVVINSEILTVHLFSRPRYCHYYFGDYYEPRYAEAGIYPWFAVRTRSFTYDPLFSYYRWHHGRRDRDWDDRVRERYTYFQEHENSRPPRTYTELAGYRERRRNDRNAPDVVNINLAVNLTQLVRGDDDAEGGFRTRVKFEKVTENRREQIRQRSQRFRDFQDRREETETQVAQGEQAEGTARRSLSLDPPETDTEASAEAGAETGREGREGRPGREGREGRGQPGDAEEGTAETGTGDAETGDGGTDAAEQPDATPSTEPEGDDAVGEEEMTEPPASPDSPAGEEQTETPDSTPTTEPQTPDEQPEPSETPEPAETPEPTEAPQPQPVEVPEPQPVETPEPAPVEVPEPAPIETPEPAPIETPEPAPVETPEPVRIDTPSTAPASPDEPAPTGNRRRGRDRDIPVGGFDRLQSEESGAASTPPASFDAEPAAEARRGGEASQRLDIRDRRIDAPPAVEERLESPTVEQQEVRTPGVGARQEFAPEFEPGLEENSVLPVEPARTSELDLDAGEVTRPGVPTLEQSPDDEVERIRGQTGAGNASDLERRGNRQFFDPTVSAAEADVRIRPSHMRAMDDRAAIRGPTTDGAFQSAVPGRDGRQPAGGERFRKRTDLPVSEAFDSDAISGGPVGSDAPAGLGFGSERPADAPLGEGPESVRQTPANDGTLQTAQPGRKDAISAPGMPRGARSSAVERALDNARERDERNATREARQRERKQKERDKIEEAQK